MVFFNLLPLAGNPARVPEEKSVLQLRWRKVHGRDIGFMVVPDRADAVLLGIVSRKQLTAIFFCHP